MNGAQSIVAALIALAAVEAGAQIRDLGELRERRVRLQRTVDSLTVVRVRLMARGDSLSERIDSFRVHDPAAPQLVRERMASRILVDSLHRIEQRHDHLQASEDSLEQQLRDAYDWEISRISGLLRDGGYDEGLLRQVQVFQEERAALGNTIDASSYRLDADHELSVSVEDGPDELRQKIAYAQDRVAQLQDEQWQIAKRLRYLEREILIMQQYWHLAEDLMRLRGRDGEAPVQLHLDESPGPGTEVRHRRALAGSAGAPPPQADTGTRGARAQPTLAGGGPQPLEAPLLLEAQQLRARQQELEEVEAVWQERIAAFHERLEQLLSGAQ